MNKKKRIDTLQDLIILCLLISAVFIITRLPFFQTSWAPRMQALLSPGSDSADHGAPADLDTVISSVHLAVMGNLEYGRHTQYSVPVDSDQFLQMLPLFREALGSAGEPESADHHQLQQALLSPSLCLDLTRQLPLEAVAFWLGDSISFPGEVRGIALTTLEDTTALYLWDESITITCCSTALSSSAVESLALTFAPNGGSFGFESDHQALAPYTILVSDVAPISRLYAALPDGYSAYNLLTALDFNAHTNSRYFESSGTEVVEVPSGSLRIGQNGAVEYSGDQDNTSPLYQLSISGQSATAVEALDGARRLASALVSGTNASPLYLSDMELTADGWLVSFRYQAEGIPVLMSSGEQALTVTITGSTITAFTYRCRTYTSSEETSTLLPPTMAAAIAAQQPGAGLSINYVDNGGELLSARWITS